MRQQFAMRWRWLAKTLFGWFENFCRCQFNAAVATLADWFAVKMA
jgi:hypothetical protein